MRKLPGILAILALISFPSVTAAFGPHDNNCVECHSIHDAKGNFSFAVPPSTLEKYPGTNVPARGVDALCLGCHNETEGILPISLMKSHPVGVKPKKAFVPAEVLKNGELGCTSCHDPHPSNPNYKYLRMNTEGGKKMGLFCASCHEAMVGKSAK